MKLDLKKYIEKGISYKEYIDALKKDIETQNNADGKLHHTELNAKRIERLHKTIQLSDEQVDALNQLDKEIFLLAITEGWCGDASQILPIISLMDEASAKIDLKIVYRDKNLELIEEYNTNGSHSIPIIVGVDKETYEHQFRFGPRPSFGMELLAKYKADPEGYPKEQFHKDLQIKYNKDKGISIFNEVLNLIKSA